MTGCRGGAGGFDLTSRRCVFAERIMDILDRAARLLGKIAAYVSALILVYMVLHILYEISLRVFFARSTYVLDEFVAYATAGITFLCLAYTLREGSMIRVGMLIHKTSGTLRLVLEFFSLTATIAVTIYFFHAFWTKTFWRDVQRGTLSESIAEVPLWIPELFAVVGLGLFLLQLFVILIRLVLKREISQDI
jgi:TRAP-type C4-dicarboxylate transport system permease small subunit